MSAPIISYAQNQEDVILYRALRDVSKGFYIDVGAQRPIAESVTKLFYERGWHGINIDPLPQWVRMLEADRPHDTNLQMAVGAHRARMPFFAIRDTGLSTASAEFAARYAKSGLVTKQIMVDVATLDEVCELHDVREVHFLKIDVEGAEEDVIRGFSFDRVRPWIVVVEAVEPVYLGNRQSGPGQAVCTNAGWEPLLLAHDYAFVYWDGLNRFYLANEHGELRSRFDAPPNPFDEFIRYEEQAGRERILQLETDLKRLTDAAALASLLNQVTALERAQAEALTNHKNQVTALERAQAEALASHKNDLQNIFNSRSWRMTGPLRWFVRQLRGGRNLVRRVMRRMLLLGLHLVRNYPVARCGAKCLLKFAPAQVRDRVVAFGLYHSPHIPPPENTPASAFQVPFLQGAGTRAIYLRLRGMTSSNPS